MIIQKIEDFVKKRRELPKAEVVNNFTEVQKLFKTRGLYISKKENGRGYKIKDENGDNVGIYIWGELKIISSVNGLVMTDDSFAYFPKVEINEKGEKNLAKSKKSFHSIAFKQDLGMFIVELGALKYILDIENGDFLTKGHHEIFKDIYGKLVATTGAASYVPDLSIRNYERRDRGNY
jgi:hypothetical protein